MKISDAKYIATLAAFVNNGEITDAQLEALNQYDEVDDALSSKGKGAKVDITLDQKMGILRVADLIETTTATRFMPKVIKTIVREAIEPNLIVVPNIFEEVRLNSGRSIEIGAIGSMYAGDVGEGREYPERQPDMDGGDMVAIHVKKSGIMVRITDEMIKDSQWDVIGIWLRAAGKALARHKEQKAIKLLNIMGQVIFDNENPTNSVKGTCTGRGEDGAPNGALSLRDLFDMVASLMLGGYTPNTLLIHPFAWAVFAMDPAMKEIAAGPGLMMPNGNGGHKWDVSHGGLGLDPQPQQPFTATYQTQPKGFPVSMQVLVSPYVPFDATKQTCSIVLLDRSLTGVLVTREPITTEQFDDPARDIQALKVMERYGFAIMNQGKGVACAHNVAIQPTYSFSNVNYHSLGPINQMVPIANQGGGVNPAGAYLGT